MKLDFQEKPNTLSLSAVLACMKDLTQARHSPEMTEAEKLAEKCCFLGVEN